MDWNREEEIRKRAMRIWEEEGKPDGKHAEHWAQAERELDGGGQGGWATERTADDLKSGKETRRR